LDSADDDFLEIESSISDESQTIQEYEDSKVDIKREDMGLDVIKRPPPAQGPDEDEMEMDLELDLEEPEDEEEESFQEIDKDSLIQSPSAERREKTSDSRSSSGVMDLDLNEIMIDEDSAYELDSPFREDLGAAAMAFESEDEELLKDEPLFLEEEEYMEVENNLKGEIEAITFWLQEIEKQRTSTIEKNMMEIFEEFKKGVDEKIGQEDYDTRYNLGIAYKEMGLLEEAIHEFLISSKHPLKFFDSAGLLGMCFREKGMFGEALSWFERAMNVPDRRKEEYMAVRYELVVTLKLKEDFRSALKLCVEILRADPNYRDVADIYRELKTHLTG